MHAVMSLVAASAVSISAGWSKLPTGGYEYIIQIEPEAVATLAAGEDFSSDVPPEARDVRSFRVRVGREPLPRESGPAPLQLGPPPAGTEIDDLGPPPAMPQTPAGVEAPAIPAASEPNLTASPTGGTAPPDAAPRHVGIHAKGPSAHEEPSSATGHETDKVSEPPAGTAGPSSTPPGGNLAGNEPAKPRPWAPLLGSLLALFASVGGNVFLGWTAVSMRGRYKALLAHQQLA
jgi:hypothetical protein